MGYATSPQRTKTWASLPRRWSEAAVLFAAVAAAHAVGQIIVYQLNHVPSTGVPFFPGDGVTVAALLLAPPRLRPVVLVATYSTELVSHFALQEMVVTAFGLALSNTIGPALSAWLARRWAGGVPLLSRRKDLVAFVVGGAVAGPVLEALTGPPFARLTTASGSYLAMMARWWTGDALGVLVVGGLILAWATERGWPIRRRYAVFEASVLVMLLVLVTWAAFWRLEPTFTYLILPMVGWASLRFGIRGATTAAAIVAILTQWATLTGHGLFAVIAGTDHNLALWLLQLFLAVVTLTGLVLAAQVAELTASRARIVAAADEVRQRIERDLHDGAQQRLVSLTLQLRAARAAVPAELGELSTGLDRAVAEAVGALDEVREIARGIHPPVLAVGGLRPALRTLARRSPVPVDLQVHAGGRLPEQVEVSAYYLVAEALTNVAKHACASAVTVQAEIDGDVLRLAVRDDGGGGADFARGTGLVGLKDRVEAIGGRIILDSPDGAGTSLRAELPLTAAKGRVTLGTVGPPSR